MPEPVPGALLLERRDDRVVATLNRPEKRNAIDQGMIDELHALCEELERDPRVLILIGAGGVFASGADIGQLRDRTAEDARRGINSTAFRRIRSLPMPVIAAVDGYALGGGAELAYAADIRIATPRVKFGNPETGLGIIAAAGATWRLPEIVGHARASELLLTGRIIDADEACRGAWCRPCTSPTPCSTPRTPSPNASARTAPVPRSSPSAPCSPRRISIRRSSSRCRPSCSTATRSTAG